MAKLTDADRRALATARGLTTAAKQDRQAMTAPMRAAAFARFEHEVDPEGALDPEERTRRARLLQRAHLLKIGVLARRESRRRANIRKSWEKRKHQAFGE